nr:LysR substrate-binding domain-containing protein [uncultured Desulfobacter sp.]
MELRQLRYFTAVAEELHFGRAAKRMNISQPPLSMQIRNLENELGTRLFNRTSRQVELTTAGEVFLVQVEQILAALDGAVESAKQAGQGNIGRLSVGFIGPAMDAFLPEIIRGFQSRYSGIRLSLTESGTSRQIEDLYAGRIQVGFVRLYRHKPDGLTAQIIRQEQYVLAVPSDHPFARQKKVALSQLKNEPFIMYPRSVQPQLYDTMMACFKNSGFTPNIVQEARTKHTTIALVAAGLGAAVVPSSSKVIGRCGVFFLDIDASLPHIEISMIWRQKDKNPALARFVKFATRYQQSVK